LRGRRLSMKDNEFRTSDVPLLVGAAAVFNVDGNFCAIQARCTHRGGPLNKGRLEGSLVTCPWHGSQFDVCSGAVRRGPATEPVRVYRATVEGDVGRIDVD